MIPKPSCLSKQEGFLLAKRSGYTVHRFSSSQHMHALQSLLDSYRHRGEFPTYAQLVELSAGLPALDTLLEAYRQGGPFPTYEQLSAIAAA